MSSRAPLQSHLEDVLKAGFLLKSIVLLESRHAGTILMVSPINPPSATIDSPRNVKKGGFPEPKQEKRV